MADFLTRAENEIGDDAENAIIAQTRVSDMARISILSALCRGVMAPEIAQVYASGLTLAEGFYVHTATGELLDNRLADFGLARRAAAAAYATVRFTRAPGVAGEIVVPEGTRVRARDADGLALDYAVRIESPMAANENTLDAYVDAQEPGARFNVGANQIGELVDAIPGLPPNGDDPALPGVSVTNRSAVTSGRDVDSDEDARGLFYAWLTARTRATPAALKLAATTYTETDANGVVRYPILSAAVREYLNAPGPDNLAARVYIVGHNGEAATAAQHEGVRRRIDGYVDASGIEVEGWRAAGILVDTADPVFVPTDVTIILTLTEKGSAATSAKLEADITARVAVLPIGVSLTVKSIYDAVRGLGDEVANARIVVPVADVPATIGQKITLGILLIQAT